MEAFWPYLKAFLVGGSLCLVGQLLIDRTKLTPARILTGYVVAGVVLSAVGSDQPEHLARPHLKTHFPQRPHPPVRFAHIIDNNGIHHSTDMEP